MVDVRMTDSNNSNITNKKIFAKGKYKDKAAMWSRGTGWGLVCMSPGKPL